MFELSLFTGAGGGILGSKLLGWKTVGYVEINDYCQRVIAQRIRDGIIDNAPIFGDIRSFISDGYAERYRGLVDVVTGGFPCQPFSIAGRRLGENDSRNMWPATRECIRIVRPRFAFLENVPGLLSSGYFGTILGELSEIGYNARWCVLSAAEMGAPHKRDRLWIFAHSKRWRREEGSDKGIQSEGEESIEQKPIHIRNEISYTNSSGLQKAWPQQQTTGIAGNYPQINISDSNQFNDDYSGSRTGEISQFETATIQGVPPDTASKRLEGQVSESRTWKYNGLSSECGWWKFEPELGRVAHGVANRVDRLRAIGNGQVPAVVRAAWELLTEGIV